MTDNIPPLYKSLATCEDSLPTVLTLRQLILDTAKSAGHSVEESLKWGEPSYKTPQGSPVRIGWSDGSVSLFVNCNTRLIQLFVERFETLRVVGSREVVFAAHESLPESALRECLRMAFVYNAPAEKRRRAREA